MMTRNAKSVLIWSSNVRYKDIIKKKGGCKIDSVTQRPVEVIKIPNDCDHCRYDSGVN